MSAESLEQLIQQNEMLMFLHPFNPVHITVNVPDDNLQNDVTLYLDKESGITLETLSEIDLCNLGHALLQDIYFFFEAPQACSVHFVYQFYSTDTHQYVDDHSYHVGEWWETKGYWVVKTYLDMYYITESPDGVIYKSWLSEQSLQYQPSDSVLLPFASLGGISKFLCRQLERVISRPIDRHAVHIAEHVKKCVLHLASPEKTALKKLGEREAIIVAYKLYDYVQRYYGHDESCEFVIRTHVDVLLHFKRVGKKLFYQTWLDNGLMEVGQAESVLTFRGQSQRKLVTHLGKQLRKFNLPDGIVVSILLPTEMEYTVMVTVHLAEIQQYLNRGPSDLLWDVYEYFNPPPDTYCYLKIQLPTRSWYIEGRIKSLYEPRSYRLKWRRNGKKWNRWGGSDLVERPFLEELQQDIFGRDWSDYDYIYRLNTATLEQ